MTVPADLVGDKSWTFSPVLDPDEFRRLSKNTLDNDLLFVATTCVKDPFAPIDDPLTVRIFDNPETETVEFYVEAQKSLCEDSDSMLGLKLSRHLKQALPTKDVTQSDLIFDLVAEEPSIQEDIPNFMTYTDQFKKIRKDDKK